MSIPLFKVYMNPDATKDLEPVLASGYIGQGPKVEEFETLLKKHFNNDYVLTVNNGTAALHLALHLIKADYGTEERNEVLTTPMTCTATNWPIMANGLDLKWVDVDLNNCNMDMDDLERKLSPKTLAIMVVHWGGYPCDMARLKAIQKKCLALYGHEPPIIEDSAHAWGATYKNKLIGTHGNYVMFSFQAIKHLTTVDGGLLITPDAATYKRGKLLRWYGLDREGSADFRCAQNIQEWGYKFHMNDVCATVGLANFAGSNQNLLRFQENSDYYDAELAGVKGVTILERNPDRKSAAWIYTMRVKDREAFINLMTAHNIHVSQVHARNDKHKCVQPYKAALPNVEILDQDMICIPNGYWVTDKDREHIVNTIKLGW